MLPLFFIGNRRDVSHDNRLEEDKHGISSHKLPPKFQKIKCLSFSFSCSASGELSHLNSLFSMSCSYDAIVELRHGIEYHHVITHKRCPEIGGTSLFICNLLSSPKESEVSHLMGVNKVA